MGQLANKEGNLARVFSAHPDKSRYPDVLAITPTKIKILKHL
jgi:hypothetical protein